MWTHAVDGRIYAKVSLQSRMSQVRKLTRKKFKLKLLFLCEAVTSRNYNTAVINNSTEFTWKKHRLKLISDDRCFSRKATHWWSSWFSYPMCPRQASPVPIAVVNPLCVSYLVWNHWQKSSFGEPYWLLAAFLLSAWAGEWRGRTAARHLTEKEPSSPCREAAFKQGMWVVMEGGWN